MSTPPRCSLSALWCCALLLGGCAEGYFTEESALILKYGMGREAALKAMNTIGQHAYLDDKWRYELHPDCKLRIESRTLASGSTELAVLTARSGAIVVDEPDPNSHTVFAHAVDETPTNGTPVLSSANWSDATQMKWLINYLPVVCMKSTK